MKSEGNKNLKTPQFYVFRCVCVYVFIHKHIHVYMQAIVCIAASRLLGR